LYPRWIDLFPLCPINQVGCRFYLAEDGEYCPTFVLKARPPIGMKNFVSPCANTSASRERSFP